MTKRIKKTRADLIKQISVFLKSLLPPYRKRYLDFLDNMGIDANIFKEKG